MIARVFYRSIVAGAILFEILGIWLHIDKPENFNPFWAVLLIFPVMGVIWFAVLAYIPALLAAAILGKRQLNLADYLEWKSANTLIFHDEPVTTPRKTAAARICASR